MDGCSSLVDVVQGNVSENKEEKNVEFEREETQPNVSNTAPILNILGILAKMPFIDDDSCHEDEDQNKSRVHSEIFSLFFSKGAPPLVCFLENFISFFKCYKPKILFTTI